MRQHPGILDAARRVRLELRDGRAGWGVRLGLTAGALAGCISVTMLAMGLIESARRGLQEEHIAIGVALAAAAWFGLVYRIWASYRRWRHALRVLAALGLIWAAAIGLSITFAEVIRGGEEYWITATIFAAASVSIALVAVAVSGSVRGRPVRGADGNVCVECPRCGYSMSGLTQTTCPECGAAFTLEELIAAQEYELPESARTAAPSQRKLPAESGTPPPYEFIPLPHGQGHE